jgi:hypothetical protein
MSSENSLVVGVIESKGWELPGAAGASRLRPGDVIVRIGPEDAKDTLEWPFPGGVQVSLYVQVFSLRLAVHVVLAGTEFKGGAFSLTW